MDDSLAEPWLAMSVQWLFRNWGAPTMVDKPYEALGAAKMLR
jgi:hypothetical protein